MGNTAHGERELEMKQIRVIKTQRDYDDAVARLSALMDEEIKVGSNKEGELELLALVIESYERSKIDPVSPDAIEAILFRMDQMNLGKKDLIPYFGSLPKVSEVLARKRPLSLSMIRKVHKGLGIPAEILLLDADDDIDLGQEPQYDYRKFPGRKCLNVATCKVLSILFVMQRNVVRS
jgi:HTH-type transcriptional regulator/antitoxin HigA